MAVDFWTDERVEHLKTLVAEGHSCSVIGAILGTTRNAVIGKANRLGLPRPATRQGKNALSRLQIRRHAKKDGSRTIFGSLRRVSDGKPMMRRISEALHSGMRNKDVAAHFGVDTAYVASVKSETLVGAEQHDPELDVAAKPLLELDAGDCRWPVGDPQKPDFGFCARKKSPGSSYCPGHLKRSLAPLPSHSNRPFILFKPGVRSTAKEDA